MIKMSLKFLTATALFLAFGLPAFAEEGFSASVTGQVRVNFEQKTQKIPGTDAEDVTDVKTSNVSLGGGDTFVDVNLKYKTASTSTTSFIRFKSDGEKRINVTSTTTEGDWTATAVAEWEEFFNDAVETSAEDDNAAEIDRRDEYVSLSNGTMTFKLGNFQPFESHRKNNAYLFNTYYYAPSGSVSDDDTGITIDNRIGAFQFDYQISDAVKVSLVYGASENTGVFGEYRSYSLIDEITSDNSTIATNTQNTTTGLLASFSQDAISVNFEFFAGEEKGVNQTGSDTNEDNSLTGNRVALGASYNLDALTFALNYASTNYERKTENLRYLDGSTDTSSTEAGYSREFGNTILDFNVGYALSDNSGVGVSYLTRTDKKNETKHVGGSTSDEDATSTTMELGYSNTIAGVLVRASYVSSSFASHDEDDDDGSRNAIKVRLQSSF